MNWVRWIVVALVVSEAGWMVYDGVRAFVVGDYMTPKHGKYAGQLGPWHHLVSRIGIPPRSATMKCVFIGYGLAWLVVTGFWIAGAPWSRWAMVAAAVLSLWYLVVGTVTSVIVLILLLTVAR